MSTFPLNCKHGHYCNENGDYSSEYVHNSSENCNYSNENDHSSSEYGHYSSEGLRLDSISNNQSAYFCPSCKRIHSVEIQHKRRKLVLDGGTIHNTKLGTIHNAMSCANAKILFHLDLEIIPGGKVWDMQRCFKKFYYNDPTPIDVVVICGLNELKEHTVERMMASYRSLVQCVMAHSRENGHTRPNSICISTLLYPPKLCSFKEPSDKTFPSYLTKETNLLSKIDDLNRAISELNKAAIGRGDLKNVFAIHLYGIRARGGGTEPHGKREHRWSYWYEEEDCMKLHLKQEWRAAVLHRIQLYFMYNTEW